MVYMLFYIKPSPFTLHIKYMREENQNMVSFYEWKQKMITTLKKKKKRKRVRMRDRQRLETVMEQEFGQIIRAQYTDKVSGSSCCQNFIGQIMVNW